MSFPAYELYKDSGVDWLGAVPSHWEPTRLKLLVREVQDRVGDESLELLGLSKSLGVVRRSELEQGASESDNYSKYKIAPAGYLVMNKMQAWNGVFGISPIRGMVSPDYAVFEFLHQGASNFLCSLFRTDLMAGVFFTRCRGMGTAFLRLNTNDFLDIKVPLPPANEQKAISSFLDVATSKIDGLVSEQRRLIELLKEKRQAVISHAVTKGLNPNAPMKPSGIQWLGNVPEHWSVQRIKHAITSIEQGWSPQCEISPVGNDEQWGVLKVGCVNYGRFTPEENKALPPTVDPQPDLGIREGDLLISRANTIELVGSAAVAERDYDNLMLCDKLYRLRMDRSRLLPRFLCYFLTCEVAREPIELGATGASPSMKNIAQSVILDLWFAAPAIDEQREIVKALRERWDAITTLIAEAERAIELLQERRTALISAAVTGKIDVRGYKPEETVA